MSAIDSVIQNETRVTAQNARQATALPSDEQALQAGQILEKELVLATNSGEERPVKGVLISGKFFALSVPENTKEGEKVLVRILAPAPQLSLEFYGSVEPQKAVNDTAIKKVLDSFKLTSDVVRQLKEALSSDPGLGISKFNRSGFSRLENNIPPKSLITDEQLSAPESLAKLLEQPNFVGLKQMMADNGRQLAKISKNENSNLNTDTLLTLERHLTKVAEEIEDAIGTKYQVVAKNRQEDSITAQNANSSETVRSTPKRFSTPLEVEGIQKLVKLFSSISTDRLQASQEDQRKLREVIFSQIDLLKSAESSVRKIFVSSGIEHNIDLLKNTILQLDLSDSETNSVLEAEFKKFFRDLLQNLERITAEEWPEEEIRRFFKSQLDGIYRNFGLVPIERRVLDQDEGALSLSPKMINILKSVEFQLKAILGLPEGHLVELFQPDSLIAAPKLLVRSEHLVGLLKNLDEAKSLIEGEQFTQNTELLKTISRLGSDINEILKKHSDPLTAEREIKEILKVALNLIDRSKIPVDRDLSKALFISDSLIGQPAQPSSDIQQNLLHDISSSMKKIIDESDVIFQAGPERFAASVLKNSRHFKELIELLRNVEVKIPEPSQELTQNLVDFAGDLLLQIEKDILNHPQRLQETLRRALEIVNHKFMPSELKDEAFPMLKLETSSLKAIENIIQSQEVLNRMNPVMQAMGEPTFLLFPCIMQGLLAKLEITHYKNNCVDEKEKKQRQGSSDASFEVLYVTLPFPSLGNVVLEVAHRPGEILLNMSFEDNDKATFIKEKIAPLEQILKNSGYEKMETSLRVSQQPKNNQPAWIKDLLSHNLRIA